ncbi:MAG: cyclic nucleotide-binding domain-containing protein [Chloroflexi bacterium]|nr:cyclic nucleotide-binding domain-containing protein [Chloroflexota bacterium]
MIQNKPQFGPEHFPSGSVIIRQGDIPDKFYIISSGRVEVVEQLPNGRERLLRTMQTGEYFGEIGMLRNSRRVATVRALTDVNVMSMDHKTFSSWLGSSEVVQEELEGLMQQRSIQVSEDGMTISVDPAKTKKRKRQTGFFEAQSMEHISMYAPGEVIIFQGDPPDKFYILVEGFVEVVHTNPDQDERIVAVLGSGDYFGEIGLMEGQPRIATVRARSEVKVVTFDRKSFKGWMNRSPASQDEISQTAVRRRRQTGMLTLPDDYPKK